MTDLAIHAQLTHWTKLPHDVERDEFAEVLKKAKAARVDVSQHPMVLETIDRFQQEFMDRKDQLMPTSLRRLQNAWAQFVGWCAQRGLTSNPASPSSVDQYLESRQSELHRNTLKVHLWAISKTHLISGCPDPTHDINVKGRMKSITRQKVREGETQKQATAFNETNLDTLVENWSASASLTQLRDLTFLSVAYETLLRKSELARITVQDVSWLDDGSARILVPYTKSNYTGEPQLKYLSPIVAELLERYLAHPSIDDREHDQDGQPIYLLQRVKSSGKKGVSSIQPISPKLVDRIYLRAWQALGLEGKPFSGHSSRVGAAQDLLREGFTTLQVMQSGGWKTERMVNHYGRQILAEEGAMAQKRRKRTR